ncbi:hypothetical protein DFA_06899 [Cavenderia fasciculata]|uniref:AIG1-type G domain-containing protein n=1 Tax=Cavenderia fasciculata TaxID=261658 RepID=F4PWZ4_CACFS|nr:uncharacterized protein DFA_06899 [Cavenderia fasciculata]EGG19797.1 hypothetical protein DFA_06899 [Cavenderia fasciculata]|eukprot:XP_004358143.1 hypothetical protein DFA_06899 [Cavenderia fasciculata]
MIPKPTTTTSSQRRQLPVSLIERTVVFVGPSGSGKSEIINAIHDYCDTEKVESRLDPKSVTQDAVRDVGTLNFPNHNGTNFALRIVDTRGLTDSTSSFVQMIPQWNKLVSRELAAVHIVVFVLPLDRLSMSLLEELAMMTQFLINWGMKEENLVVILNKCDFFIESLVENYVQKLSHPDAKIPDIIRKAPVLRACFLNRRVVIPEMEEHIEKLMVNSTNQLIDILLKSEKIVPFYPKEAILRQSLIDADNEKRAADAAAKAAAAKIDEEKSKTCVLQ